MRYRSTATQLLTCIVDCPSVFCGDAWVGTSSFWQQPIGWGRPVAFSDNRDVECQVVGA